MRYRERYWNSTAAVMDYNDFCHYPCSNREKQYPYIGSLRYEGMLDEVIPNFKRLSAEGQVFSNFMFKQSLTASKVPCNVDYEYIKDSELDPYTYRASSTYDPELPVVFVKEYAWDYEAKIEEFFESFNAERSVAEAQAWANVDVSEALILATLGEMPETIKWFVSLYQRAIELFKKFGAKKKLLKKSNSDYIDARLDFWMEFRYAFRPLMYELQQYAEIDFGEKPPRETARGYHEVEIKVDLTNDLDLGSRYFVSQEGVSMRQSTYRAGVLYCVSAFKNDWITILGFDKPLESLWELTTLSFAIDWFLNVGDVLATHTTSASLTPLCSWCSEKHVYTTDIRFVNMRRTEYPGWENNLLSSQDGSLVVHNTLERRVPLASKPILPSPTINLDWAKVVDLSAIARSVYRNQIR